MSTTTSDVSSVDLRGAALGASTSPLLPASGRAARLTGGPRIAPVPVGRGAELRPRHAEDRSVVNGGRVARTTASTTDFAPVADALPGDARHDRSCGTPVPGSAPSATAP